MMEKTWRWFGKKDKITLPMLRQIGVEGIVTALHEVPNGEIWTVEAINDLKSYIESYGLRWSVVESLPVCEAIKYAGTEREQLIENYKVSLANLSKCGVKTVLQLHAGNRLDTYGFTVPLAGRYQFALLRPYSFRLLRHQNTGT